MNADFAPGGTTRPGGPAATRRITVAICTWNRADLLGPTLERLRELRAPAGASWDVLVVNNNCTDRTDEVASRYFDVLPLRLVHEPRPGKVHALNAAVREANGDIVAFTDDDALVDPTWLVELAAAFDQFDADMVFGRVEPWWEGKAPPWYSDQFRGAFALLDYGGPARRITDPTLTPYGVNYAFRRSVFAELGGFADALAIGPAQGIGCGGEDDEIFARLLSGGRTVAYAPAALVKHFIPTARCEKSFHRRRAWDGATVQLEQLRAEAARDPRLAMLLGLPRYFYRVNANYFVNFLNARLRGDASRAFYFELKLRRFAGILCRRWSRAGRLRRKGVQR